jgi:hypothetical protein
MSVRLVYGGRVASSRELKLLRGQPEVVPQILSGKLPPEAVTARVVTAGEATAAWLEPVIKLVVRMDL